MRPQRHVRAQPQTHRVFDQFGYLLDKLPLGRALVQLKRNVPVAFDAGAFALREDEVAAGLEFLYPIEKRRIGEAELKREILPQPVGVRSASNGAGGDDGFDLACEDEPPRLPGIVERLYPDAVATAEESPFAHVPDGEGPHAVETADAPGAPLLIRMDDDFRVAAGVKTVSAGLQLSAQLDVVVNAAVECDPDCGVFVGKRLGAVLRVYYREAVMRQNAVALPVRPEPLAVRAPVRHGRKHYRRGPQAPGGGLFAGYPQNPAHKLSLQ